jgi:peroxiredoxin Q/BCP
VILGASFNDVTKNAAFAEKYDFPYPLLCDTDRKLGLAYGAAADAGAGHAARVGVIIGPDGRIVSWSPKVDARGFPQQALDAIPA